MMVKTTLAALFSFITVLLPPDVINIKGTIVKQRFNPPSGYERIKGSAGSFADYLQSQKLKPAGSPVLLYNGAVKGSAVHEAVFTTDVGKRDLQQCADAVMRLRAEYLFAKKEYQKIHFNFTNGFNATYDKWAQGYRIKVSGNNVSWYKTNESGYSYSGFRKYLDLVFMYAGTLSLAKELKKVDPVSVQVGDVLIHGGSPGHAVIVVDVAKNASGKKVFMLAQSYMPAQEIHVLKNSNNPSISPWYELDVKAQFIKTPEWTFEMSDWKRFAD